MKRIPGQLRFWSLMLLLATGVHDLRGQGTYGVIVGSARDSSGGAMPGVTVIATNERTGQSFRSVTSEVGAYTFSTPGYLSNTSRGHRLSSGGDYRHNFESESNRPV